MYNLETLLLGMLIFGILFGFIWKKHTAPTIVFLQKIRSIIHIRNPMIPKQVIVITKKGEAANKSSRLIHLF